MNLNPFKWLSRKTVDITALIEQGLEGMEKITSYSSLARQGYSGNADVFSCVREIAVSARGIPWLLQRTTNSGKIEDVTKHPLLDLIYRPNPAMGGAKFIEWLVSYHLTAGTAYIYRAGPDDVSRPPRELYLLRPSSVTPNLGERQGEIANYTYRTGKGSEQKIRPELILSLPFFNPESEVSGLSPIQVASSGVQIGNEGRSWNRNLLRNGAKPPGALHYEGTLTEDQRKRAEDKLQERLAGWKNAGRPAVMEGKASWVPFGFSPTDMDWSNSIKLSTLDVCRVYNVAPELIGMAEAKTYSNYQEARKALYHETVLPLMDWLADELNHWLIPLYSDNIRLVYDADSIEALREDQELLYKRAYEGVTRGVLTPNEAREMIGKEPIDGGDILLISGNMVPIEMLSGNSKEL